MTFAQAMAATSRRLSIRATMTLVDTTVFNLTSAHIMAYTVDDGGSSIPLGMCASGVYTMELANSAGEWLYGGSILGNRVLTGAKVAIEIGVYHDAAWDWAHSGTFYVDKPSATENDTRIKLSGFDPLVEVLEVPYEDTLGYRSTTTLQNVLDHIRSKGVTIGGTLACNASAIISKEPDWGDDCTIRTALGYVAQMGGCFVRCDREGAIELVPTQAASVARTVTTSEYLTLTDDENYFNFNRIKALPAGGKKDDFVVSYITDTAESAANTLKIEENPLLRTARTVHYRAATKWKDTYTYYTKSGSKYTAVSSPVEANLGSYYTHYYTYNTTDIQGMVDALKTALTGLAYRAQTIKLRGDPTLMCGDRITIVDTRSVSTTFSVVQQRLTFDGGSFSAEISCPLNLESVLNNGINSNGTATAPHFGIGTLDGSIIAPSTIVPEHFTAGSVTADAIAAKTITAEEITAHTITATEIAAQTITATEITSHTITADQIAAGTITASEIASHTVTADEIASHTITAEQIAAGTITATEIKAGTITANEMAAGTITAESGIIGNAAIGDAQIGTAGISFLKVRDVVGDSAIFEEVLGGKFHISRLAVTEANMVSLTTGKLVVRGDDGAFYRLSVDGEGNVVAALTQVSNDNIADVSLDAGEKLIKSSITADCLNVDEIMGGSAFIGKIKAGHIGAGEIETNHISAAARAALTLLATNATPYVGANTFSISSTLTPLGSGHLFEHDESINGVKLSSTSPVPVGTFRIPNVITENGQWTVSGYIHGSEYTGSSYYLDIDACNYTPQRVYLPETPQELKHFEFTFTVANFDDVYNFVDFATSQWVTFWIKDLKIERGNKATAWSPNILDPARGVKTSYIQIFNDAMRLITGGTLSAEGATFDIATDLFTIQNLAKTLTMLEVANGRVGGEIAVFTHTISDVPNTFPGGTIPWAGSFQASLNNIGKWLLADSTLTISGNISEDVSVPVFIGSRLSIKLASGTKFTGHITFNNCANVRMYADAQNTTNIIGTGTDYAVKLDSSHVVMENLHISGKVRTSADDATLYGIIVTNASTLTAKGCTVDRTKSMGMLGDSNSKIDIYQCKGGVVGGDYTTLANAGWGVYVQRNADVSLYDTCPFGASGGAGYWIGDIRGTATNTPTDGTTPAAPSVRPYAVSAGYTVRTTTDGSDSVTWASGEPRQGRWSEFEYFYNPDYEQEVWDYRSYNGFGLLLLTNAANIVSDRPAGKTIISATMKIRRDAEAGTSETISCTLYQHGTAAAPSGKPNDVLFAQAADAVDISPNQEITITLNASAITNLNNGNCKGFGFKNIGGYGRYDIFGELVVTYG